MIRAVVARTLAVLLVAAAWSPRPVHADAVVGTGTADSCTEAALDSALAGGGSVTFDCGGAATITVSSTKTISADTAIDGGGEITISGGNSVGVFYVNTGVIFTVQNLTIANGHSASYGGGIYNGGGGRGGGGTVTVTNSTFSGNSAPSGNGGGIHNGGGGGAVTVTNSTFSGNSASEDGGGIASGGSTVTVTNSTFSGNSASSGGGIYNNGGTITVTNTIVAHSTSGGNCSGAVTDGGHNIDDGTTCGFTGTGCTATTGTSFCNTNPDLDPTGLQNNGGPTQTIALCGGIGIPDASCTSSTASPAIDAGDETVCAAPPVNDLDQRGYIRPGAGATSCSIGAYEYNSPGPPCVGDCNDDGHVTVNDILTMVNIALGNASLLDCEAGDANHDAQITIDEILTAVNNALNGCSVP